MAPSNNMRTFHKRFTCLDFEIFLTLKKMLLFHQSPQKILFMNCIYEDQTPHESNLLIALRNFCASAFYSQKICPSFVQPSKVFAFQLPLLRKSALQSFNLQKFHFLYTQRFFLLRKFRQLGVVYIKWNGNYLIYKYKREFIILAMGRAGKDHFTFFPCSTSNSEGLSSIRYVPCRIGI